MAAESGPGALARLTADLISLQTEATLLVGTAMGMQAAIRVWEDVKRLAATLEAAA